MKIIFSLSIALLYGGFVVGNVVADSFDYSNTKFFKNLPPGSSSSLVVSFSDVGLQNYGETTAPLVSGSLQKFFISGALLSRAQSDKPSAELLADVASENGRIDGNIYLRGYGQALLSTTDLQQVAQSLVSSGLTHITGNIVADDTFFHIDDWIRQRSGSAYATPGALGLDLHTVRLTVKPTQPGQPPEVGLEPVNKAARIAVAARTVSGERNDIRITRLDDLSYKVSGEISVDAGSVDRRFPLDDPALYAAGTLKSLLEENGIKVEGRVRKGRAPETAVVLAEIHGPTRDKTLTDMNQYSLNVVADNLLLSLGAERYGPPGTREKGVKAVEEFLAGLGLPMDEVTVYDGSGLSDRNRVTANFMARYLYEVSEKPWFGRFKQTLPRPGYEGTVTDLGFKDDRFRVKTGRLEDVYALAGYGVDGRGEDVAFCYIVNGPGVGILPNMDQIGADVLRSIAGETGK